MKHSKILLVLVALLISITFSGCGEKIVYVPEPYEVRVPVKCIVPDTDCTITKEMNDSEVVIELMKCIIDLKKAQEVCK